jgi:hypothetical protein
MSFSSRFPITAWVWSKLKAPLTRKLFYVAIVVAIISTVVLHIEAAVFAFRTRSLLLALRRVDEGQTTKEELLQLIPSLHRVDSVKSNCGAGAGENFQVERSNLPSSAIEQRVFSVVYESSALYKGAYLLGYRPRRLFIDANISHGVVTRWAFSLDVAPPENRYPGAIMVRVSSPISVIRYSGSAIADEQNPYFSARRYFKWPDWNLEVSYSRLATQDVKDAAVDLHLGCLWSLRGCTNAAQLLPRAEEERTRIQRAAMERITSRDPCPPWIIPAKVRDANEIVLLQIETATSKRSEWPPFTPGVASKYRILRTLQLRDARFRRIGRDATWFPSQMYGDLGGIANPSTPLIKPGAVVVVFEGRGAASTPCNVLPATSDVLGRVNEAITLRDWSYG